ncbi:MAG TPA: hypothetical protein VL860_05295, partial [Planctomycetota bacterium]|nr:hypothetical protein [Planctomycetota bacterium]
NDTGVFIGKLIVRPATGENIPNQLELIEGEGVTVEYRDQAREDGHHNYRLTGSLPGAPVGLGAVAIK